MEYDLDPVVMINLGVAGFIGFIGLMLSPIDIGTVVTMSYGELLAPSLVFGLFAAVPGMVAGAVSLEGFRRESLLSVVFLSAGLVSRRLFFIGLFIAASTILASYKARSVYNGRNRFWSLFSVAGSVVFVLALVMGLFIGQALLSQPQTREEFRTALTGEITDQTLAAVNATLDGGSPVGQAQQRAVTRLVTRVAHNTSAVTVTATEQLIMAQVRQANRQFGKFDQQEQRILQQGFEAARSQIPSRISQRIGDRINASMSGAAMRPSGEQLRKDIRGRVGGLMDLVFSSPRRVAVFGFITVFSPIAMLKLPLSLLFGGVSWLVLRLKQRLL